MYFYSVGKSPAFLAALFFSVTVFGVKAQSTNGIEHTSFCGYHQVNTKNGSGTIQGQTMNTYRTNESEAVYTLPVVVHVIYSSACEDLSDTRYKYYPTDNLIRFEVEEASQRFRHNYSGAKTYINPYYGADIRIELKLATVDPNGAYTSGIERIVNSQAEGKPWELIPSVLDQYKWDSEKYCNIFIVKNMTNASGVYIEGGDYTVYNTNAFWSGLLNHELGHYLGLTHTFVTENNGCPANNNCQTSGDRICDTPPKYSAGSLDELCQGNIFNSCTSDEADVSSNNPYRPVSMGGMGDQPDMISNYMDYSGKCWDSYTEGQKIRMRSVMETKIQMIDFAATAFTKTVPAYYLNVKNIQLVNGCTEKHTPVVEVENKGSSSLQSFTVSMFNGTAPFAQLDWTGNIMPGETIELLFPGVSVTNTMYTLNVLFEKPDNQTLPIYQTGMCKQVNYINYTPSAPLSIPFAACKDSELDKITNGVSLNWSTLAFAMYQPGRDCRQCVAALLHTSGAPYDVQQASFELLPRDFTNFNHPAFSFKMGYTPPAASDPDDILSVTISVDCGAYETVWEATGLALRTNNPAYDVLDGYRNPLCIEYKDIGIDLANYAYAKDVRIRIEAKGKFSGPLYMDDILISNTVATDIVAKEIKDAAFYFANPVTDELIVQSADEFDLFQVLNLNGQMLFQTNSKQINVSQLVPGLYFLVAQQEQQKTLKKFVKQ